MVESNQLNTDGMKNERRNTNINLMYCGVESFSGNEMSTESKNQEKLPKIKAGDEPVIKAATVCVQWTEALKSIRSHRKW